MGKLSLLAASTLFILFGILAILGVFGVSASGHLPITGAILAGCGLIAIAITLAAAAVAATDLKHLRNVR